MIISFLYQLFHLTRRTEAQRRLSLTLCRKHTDDDENYFLPENIFTSPFLRLLHVTLDT